MAAQRDELYIVLDNYGFPQFADEECQKLRFLTDPEEARAYAEQLAEHNPNTVVTVYQKVASIFHDGRGVRTIDET